MTLPLIPQGPDLELCHNADFTHAVVIQTSGVADVITGRSYKAELRKDPASTATPEATMTCTVTDGPNGTVTMTLATALTLALIVGQSYYLDIRDITGGVSLPPLVKWRVRVVQEITK